MRILTLPSNCGCLTEPTTPPLPPQAERSKEPPALSPTVSEDLRGPLPMDRPFYWKGGSTDLHSGDYVMGAGHCDGSWDPRGNSVPLWCGSPLSPLLQAWAKSITSRCCRKGSAWFGSVCLRQTHAGLSSGPRFVVLVLICNFSKCRLVTQNKKIYIFITVLDFKLLQASYRAKSMCAFTLLSCSQFCVLFVPLD